jgi:hypothetical protein
LYSRDHEPINFDLFFNEVQKYQVAMKKSKEKAGRGMESEAGGDGWPPSYDQESVGGESWQGSWEARTWDGGSVGGTDFSPYDLDPSQSQGSFDESLDQSSWGGDFDAQEAAGRMNDGRMGYGGLKGASRGLAGKGKGSMHMQGMWPQCAICTGRHDTSMKCPNAYAVAQGFDALQGALVDADGQGLRAKVFTGVISHYKNCRSVLSAGQSFFAFFRLRWHECGFITKLSRNNDAMNSDLATIVIGDFPSDAADFLRAEAEAAGTSLSDVCEGILLAYVEEQES